MKRQRVRTAARWAGTVACVLLAGVWVGNIWWGVAITHCGQPEAIDRRGGAWLKRGALLVVPPGSVSGFAPTEVWRWWVVERGSSVYVLNGGGRQVTPVNEPFLWRPDFMRSVNVFFTVPLYLPLALTLLPTAWLWRGEVRRRRLMKASGCAGCGYDRKGLAAGAVCPECGAAPSATS